MSNFLKLGFEIDYVSAYYIFGDIVQYLHFRSNPLMNL